MRYLGKSVLSKPLTSRRVRFETLETRSLLSVTPFVGPVPLEVDDAAMAGEVDQATADVVIYDRVRVALVTPEYLSGDKFDEFIRTIEWPVALGEVPLDKVERLASLKQTYEDRGPYTTWIRISVSGDIDALAEMDSVEFYKLDSECKWVITPKAERLVNSITDSGLEPVEMESPGSPVEGDAPTIPVVVGLRSEDRILDLEAWLNGQGWPASLGEVHFYPSSSLSFPEQDDGDVGWRTVLSMDVTGDIAGFEGLDSVEFVRVDDGLSATMGAKTQRLLNQMSDSGLEPTIMEPAMIETGTLINLDDFNANSSYSGIDGAGYSAVVLDTGADLNHPFFGPDSDSDGIADRIVYQYDFGDGDAFADDTDGHGTNVAGILASQDATRPGVASGANIIILKVFGSGGTGLEGALRWVAQHVQQYNIRSVNMSLTVGWEGMSSGPHTVAVSDYPISDELAAIAAQNVTVVSASGNMYASGDVGVFYPSSDINSLSVGAVFDTDLGNNVQQHSAYLTDSVLEDELFTRPSKSLIYDIAEEVYNVTARNFELVRAYATKDDNCTDKAKLHDAEVPNDYVLASYYQSVPYVQFYTDYGSTQNRIYTTYGFDWIKCYSLSGTDYRTIDASVLYDLYWDGSWADV